jgi:DNA polymerase-3 subunit alpha
MIQLHLHSEYSFLDGYCRIENIPKKAKEMGQNAVAITDHGNMHGFVDFYKACKKEDVKPIIGCEVYLVDDRETKDKSNYHLILLAKNNEGLKNLNKLVSESYISGFYYKPRIDKDLLREHSEGLIGLSACLGGEIPKALQNDNKQKAKELAKEYSDIFADGDFYVEIQANEMQEQYKMNVELVELARDLDLPLVATTDIHYLDKNDADPHDTLLAVQTGTTVNDKNRFRFENDKFYYKSEEETRNGLFLTSSVNQELIDEAIDNTYEIADKCNVELTLGETLFPPFEVPEGYTKATWLRKRCYEELFEYSIEEDIDIDEYVDQLEFELDVIIEKGFPGYFLITEDFIKVAKEDKNMLIGPGRGSAGGCLISYLLDIIAIDPLKHGLFFTRFLNKEREAMPDIDLDFSKERRSEIIHYVEDKYGQEHVSKIGTFGTMATKAAIKDAARALGIDFDIANKISDEVPDEAGDIEEALELGEKFKDYEKAYPDLFKYAKEFEGRPRQAGTHACGVVITPEPVVNYTPLMVNDGEIVTQTEKKNSEKLGLLKMDFLGLKTLDLIKNTINYAKNNGDYPEDDIQKFDDTPPVQLPDKINNIWDIPLDNENIYNNIYQEGDTNGVFQCESSGFKKMLKRMQPTKFEHIVASLALYRPGPIQGGVVDSYIDRMHGDEEVEYSHEDLEEVLEPTYGLILYQEQILKIAQIIAGYSMGEADLLRRAVGKKIESLMEEQRIAFVEGTVENGYSRDLGEELFDLIDYFSGYGFNKAHSTGYSFVSYVTAYLKNYYPAEFYASLMSLEVEDKSFSDSELDKYIADCLDKDVEILPPDINESNYGFTPVDNSTIRFGLSSIKGVGAKGLEEIVKYQPYKNMDDMYNRVNRRKANKTVFESLIKAGCFDTMDDNRNKLLEDYKELKESGGQRSESLFGDMYTPDTNKEDIIKMEKEKLGIPITYMSDWMTTKDGEKTTIEGKVTNVFTTRTKHGDLMAFVTISTLYDDIEVVVFPSCYGDNHHLLENGKELKVKGKKDESKLLAKKVKQPKE